MPVSHQHRCLFIHIPKTGGTSIEKALDMHFRNLREDRDRLFGAIRSRDLKRLGLGTGHLQHLTLAEAHAVRPDWPFADYLSFAFVRNPWDRMVSSFSKQDGHLLRTARARGVELRDLGFEDFVRAAIAIEHAHTRPQHEYIVDEEGGVGLDFVGRFESLSEDFAEVCRRLGIRKRLPHEKRSSRSDRDYRRYYTDAARQLVAERYRRDIDLFGYEF
jgi:hypothetical protein